MNDIEHPEQSSPFAKRLMNRILYGKAQGILGFVSKHQTHKKNITTNF